MNKEDIEKEKDAYNVILEYLGNKDTVLQSQMYRHLVDNPSAEPHVIPHWAFYTVLETLENKGIIESKPITQTVDYEITIKDKNDRS